MVNNSYGRHIDSVTDVHGREVKLGTDCDAVTIGDFVLGPEVRDDFMKLLMQADTEAKAWARQEEAERAEAHGPGCYCPACNAERREEALDAAEIAADRRERLDIDAPEANG